VDRERVVRIGSSETKLKTSDDAKTISAKREILLIDKSQCYENYFLDKKYIHLLLLL